MGISCFPLHDREYRGKKEVLTDLTCLILNYGEVLGTLEIFLGIFLEFSWEFLGCGLMFFACVFRDGE